MSKEYIEREAALKSIKETIIGASEFANDVRIAAINAVNSAPTADVREVRHGKWIPIKNRFFSSTDGRGGNVVKCSACGEHSSCKLSTPYCSICGAKMDKE